MSEKSKSYTISSLSGDGSQRSRRSGGGGAQTPRKRQRSRRRRQSRPRARSGAAGKRRRRRPRGARGETLPTTMTPSPTQGLVLFPCCCRCCYGCCRCCYVIIVCMYCKMADFYFSFDFLKRISWICSSSIVGSFSHIKRAETTATVHNNTQTSNRERNRRKSRRHSDARSLKQRRIPTVNRSPRRSEVKYD